MIKEQSFPVPATTRLIEVHFCDICGDRITPLPTDDVEAVCYGWEKITVRSESESCRFTEFTEFDVCPGCFHEKLIPLLATIGAKPHVYQTKP